MVQLAVQCAEEATFGRCEQPTECGWAHSGAPHFACFQCSKVCGNANNLAAHVRGQQHQNNLHPGSQAAPPLPRSQPRRARSDTPPLLSPPPLEERPASEYCPTCDQQFGTPRGADGHYASPRHIRKVKHSKAKGFAESSKSGVNVVQGGGVVSRKGITFGEIELSSLEFSPTRQAEYHITYEGRQPLFFEGVSLLSAASGFSNFTVQQPPPHRPLVAHAPFVGILTFNPHGTLGQFDDVAIFAFATAQGGRFTIHRPLWANVLVEEDKKRHEPTPPFAKSKSKHRRARDVVRGPNVGDGSKIPWVVKFGEYKVPVEGGVMPLALTEETYEEWMHNLLWMEELQEADDITRYDMNGAKLTLRGRTYFLTVPGLAEKRPSVLIGDSIKVRASGSAAERFYEGRVTIIEQNDVGMLFNRSFQPAPGTTFHCQFTVSRIVMRRMHHALMLGAQPRLVFPELDRYPPPPRVILPARHPGFFNPRIGTNERQSLAVKCIIEKSHGASPFLIFGPPGTGKTVTLVEAIRQLVAHQDATILVCAPSNSACDIIAERLVALGADKLFRLYASTRPEIAVPEILRPFTFSVDGTYSVPKLEHLLKFRVIVSTCIASSTIPGVGVPQGHFSHIFVDESGQTVEPAALIPLSVASPTTSVVLVGDPKQLGPIVHSGVAESLGLDRSLLERLMLLPSYDPSDLANRGRTVVMLVNNYRSHPMILNYPNTKFYRNELVPCAAPSTTDALRGWDGWRKPSFPIIFHAIKGGESREGNSPSFFNQPEMTQVKQYIERLLREPGVKPKDIGVISPYNAQVKKLRKEIQHEEMTVGSVEEFQGQERKVILVSTVRSNSDFLEFDARHSLGFVSNPKRFNVTVTRAQAGLIIVGDPSVLELDKLWAGFLCYIHRHGGWRGQYWDASRWERNPNYDAAQDRRQKAEEEVADHAAAQDDLSTQFRGLVISDDDETDSDDYSD
ncbi:hypothetical protein RQP46_009746 [Phenoliferia psychrophenolica]